MKNLFATFSLVFLVSLSATAQQGSLLLIKANRASLEKRYNEAIQYYTQYIKLNPKDFRGYFNRGTTRYNAGKHSDGIVDFDQCLDLNPIYKEAYYYRAKCKEAIHKNEAAIADYTFILQKDSMNVAFLKARANCFMSMKHFQLALSDLDRAVGVHKLDGNIYKLRAEAKIGLKDLLGAIYDYDVVEALIPEYKMVHYLKGNLYLELNRISEACDEWHMALDHGVVVAERNHQKYCHE